MAASARFCGGCGTPTRQHERAVDARRRGEVRATSRAALAFGTACVVTLFGLLAVSSVADLDDLDGWQAVLLGALPTVAATLAAGFVAGGLRHSFPMNLRWHWLLLAVPGAALTLGVALGYVELLSIGRAGSDDSLTDYEPTLPLWAAIVVFAPLFEEWLCRGVAWNAAARMSSPRTALVLTSILFAFLHGLGGFLLALPHRFCMGLIAGWLRWRSGSILPAILLHALHNAAAVAWFGG